MDDRYHAISHDLQSQWQDHFHMRDQTWRILQYSILLFLGVVGLEINDVERKLLIPAYCAVVVTSLFGALVAIHHRRRQKEKFEIITIYEKELGLYKLIEPVLKKANKRFLGRLNTSTYIVFLQLSLALISALLLIRAIGM